MRIKKRWFRNNSVEPADLDEIADKTVSWSSRVDNNFKQIGLDLNGDTYSFNNNGVKTFTESLNGRLVAVESAQSVGPRNLAVDVSTSTDTVSLTASDGSALTTANLGKVNVNSVANTGRVIDRSFTAPVNLKLTGAHWSFDTLGDLTDFPLWLCFIEDGTQCLFGITAQAGQTTITTGNVKNVASDVTAINHIFTSVATVATANVSYWGRLLVNFDDTGGANENLWTFQTGTGDVELHYTPTNLSASLYF